jgi:hypothetical protein
MLKKLLLFLALSWTLQLGLSQTTSQPSPLTDQEKEQVINQLKDLRDLRLITLPQYELELAKLNEALAEKDKIDQDKLSSEQEKTAAAIKERDVFKAKAEFYENSLKTVTKKRSKWCGFFKFITFGISGCR